MQGITLKYGLMNLMVGKLYHNNTHSAIYPAQQ